MVTHRHVRKLLGRQVYCHTHFGTFKGIVIHYTKHHLVLGSVHSAPYAQPPQIHAPYAGAVYPYPIHGQGPYGQGPYFEASDPHRPFGMGPGGPMGHGPGGPQGTGGSGGPGHGGPNWGLAVPLAAILGITAVGMHWW